MITEKNHKLLTSQIFLTDCTKKGLASMHTSEMILVKYVKLRVTCIYIHVNVISKY
jgi:hypothetical protein